MNPIDIYRTFNFIGAECKFFSSVHRIFFRTGYIIGHKASLTKKKKKPKTKTTPCILSDHYEMKLKINKSGNASMWRLDTMLLNDQ